MARASFDKIADAIKDHEVFKTAGSGRRQPPPSHQLLVLLRYLGTPGGGRGATGARGTFGIGSGTAELYRQRARSALRSIRRGAIGWPSPRERQRIAARMQRTFGLQDCVGIVDACRFPLRSRPARASTEIAPTLSRV
jgi:hypothetical protein